MDKKMYCIDFGASGGVDPNLKRMLPNAKIALIEPGKKHYKKIPKEKGTIKLNLAAGRFNKKAVLYDPTSPGASIYKENFEILSRYADHVVNRKNKHEPKIKIKITSVKEIIKKTSFPRVDAVKIDTQGSELNVLLGLKDAKVLKNICSIYCEGPSIPGGYLNCPELSEVLKFFSQNDYELFDILPNRAFAISDQKFSDLPKFLGTSAKTMDVDLLFFLKPKNIIKRRDKNFLFRQIIAYCAYNYYIEAIELISRSSNTFLDSNTADDMVNYVEETYKKNTPFIFKLLNKIPKKIYFINSLRKIFSQGIKRSFPHGL